MGVLFSLDGDAIQEVEYRETEHYRITRDFLNAPERYFKHLFSESRMKRGTGEPAGGHIGLADRDAAADCAADRARTAGIAGIRDGGELPGYVGGCSCIRTAVAIDSESLLVWKRRTAVLLSAGGKWRGMGPAHSYRDKLFWWRQGYDGSVEVAPELQVAARRLDGEGSVSTPPRATGAKHEDFGGWAMLVGLEFPTAGCWQVTGKYRSETLSFVVEVGEQP